MDQEPDANDRIADNRAMRRLNLAISGADQPIVDDSGKCSRSLLRHSGRPFKEPALRHPSSLAHAVFDFSSGLRAIVLRQTLRPHARSARARFVTPDLDAGGVPDCKGVHEEAPGQDNAIRAS